MKYILHWITNWWYVIKSGNQLNCLYFCSFLRFSFSVFTFVSFLTCEHRASLSHSICVCVSVSTCLCATRANKKQPTIAYSTFIGNFKFIYCCRSSLSNEYCTNNKYLYGQRKTTELHPDTHFYFSIWKSNRHEMENIDGKKAHAQIHKSSNTRAHTHNTHVYSIQNDKTIFEIFLQLFVKDILVDIRNDTIVYVELNWVKERRNACNRKGYV